MKYEKRMRTIRTITRHGINKPRIYSFNEVQDLLEEQKQEIRKIIKKEKWSKEWTGGMCGEEGEKHNKSIDDILEVLNKEK